MQIEVNGKAVFAATGGKDFDAAKPAMVFLHGAGMDHTVWVLLARWFAHRGLSVLAVDLPGHGRSEGEALTSIADMSDWTAALLESVGVSSATLIGHSMGSLIAIETAAKHAARVTALGLIGTAAAMPVSPDLLTAAKANDHAAIDMVDIWGHGYRASLGGSLNPGAWMLGGGMRLLEACQPGVLFADLAACNDYRDGIASAGRVKAPGVLVLGERDMMTPSRAGRELAKALPDASAVVLKGAGHMLMSERPDEVLAALRELRLAQASAA